MNPYDVRRFKNNCEDGVGVLRGMMEIQEHESLRRQLLTRIVKKEDRIPASELVVVVMGQFLIRKCRGKIKIYEKIRDGREPLMMRIMREDMR